MPLRDEARAILADPRAPEAEKAEARWLLEREHQPTAARDLPVAPAALAPVLDAIRSGEAPDALLKAAGGNVLPFSRPGRRSSSKGGPRSERQGGLKVGDSYVEKTGAIDYAALRSMVANTPILSAIVATRIRQMMRFCTPSEDGGPGYVIRHADKEREATGPEKAKCKELSRFFADCGWERNPRRRKALRRDPFPAFMAKLLRDSLTMDAAPIETEMRFNRDLGIDGLYAVDGATVRLCSEEDGHEGDGAVFAVQVVDGKVACTYTMDQLVYEVRNPRTELDAAGYGMAETELLVRTVTALLNAVTYNADFFDKNSIPKGLLQIFGEYGQEDLGAFRRHWNQMVRGVGNNWALPVLVSKDAQSGATYTPFNAAADEMAFGRWLTFLTSVACAVYCIDPSEIGFESFAAAKSSLSGDDTGEKLASSHAKGLMPIASHYEGVFTDYIVSAFDDELCFRFIGLEDEDKARIWEAKQLVCTVDEIRAEEGYVPFPDARVGALPVNPNLITAAMELNNPQPGTGDYGAEQPEAQPEQGGEDDFGAEAAPPEEAGEDFGTEPPPPEPKKPTAKKGKR